MVIIISLVSQLVIHKCVLFICDYPITTVSLSDTNFGAAIVLIDDVVHIPEYTQLGNYIIIYLK